MPDSYDGGEGRRSSDRHLPLTEACGGTRHGAPNSRLPLLAGYDPSFVTDVFQHLDLDARATVMDPWNGAGTTTAVAAKAGRSSYGFALVGHERSDDRRPRQRRA
jgi:hypothetical protein